MILLAKVLTDLRLIYHGTCPPDLGIDTVTDDSRRADASTLFVAIKGTKIDGHQFLGDVAARGCRAALVQEEIENPPEGLVVLRLENTRRALALIAMALVGNPTRQMRVVGVTGTNGKTTVSYLMESIFRAAGMKCGVIGTINYRWDSPQGPVVIPAPQTTPSPLELAARLGQMRLAGVEVVMMEVSSHAIDQCRADGIFFHAAALTNITQDHLDYHETMEAYARAKLRLFTDVLPVNPIATAVINIDDELGPRFAKATRAANVLTYGMRDERAKLYVESILLRPRGMTINLRLPAGLDGGAPLQLRTPMLCLFNAVNCVTAAGLALALGLPREAIIKGIDTMTGAPGRFEFVANKAGLAVIVDYAHTPDALRQVLLHARGVVRKRLIAVFGCGGDRDPGKRPLMGEAAAQIADEVIITSDNPRSEDPQTIADQIAAGIKNGKGSMARYKIVLDRHEAISRALQLAKEGDCVVIAGKGHEDYQILGPKKIHFDDREEARAMLAQR